MNCPICNSSSELVYNLPKSKIINELENYWQEKFPENNRIVDYAIYKCIKCSTEFADPLIEGDATFYEWITKKNNYYSSGRWEFHSLIKILQNNKSIQLLDVGCGDGQLLKLIESKIDKGQIIELFGIDKTSGPIKRYKESNSKIKLYNRIVDESLINDFSKRFNYISLFHVFEHISNPQYFLSTLLQLLKDDGRIIISTPNSPMTFEHFWFDIMNNPPHHMLRLNENSYKALAEKYNLNVEFIYNNEPLITDISSILKLYYDGRFGKNRRLLSYFLLNPLVFVKILIHSLFNRKSNTILVILKKKSN